MRTFLVVALLLAPVAFAPTVSAAPVCWYDPDRVNCLVDHGQGYVNGVIDRAQELYGDLRDATCLNTYPEPTCILP